MTTQERFENCLIVVSSYPVLYLVELSRSRTGQKRYYRVFAIDDRHEQNSITDVTCFVCPLVRTTFDNIRGTLNLSQGGGSSNRHFVEYELTRLFKKEVRAVLL